MAVVAGKRYSDTDTYNIGIDMSDTLSWLDPSDVPTLHLVGGLQTPCVAVKHEWLEDSLRPLDGAVAASGTSLNNTTDPVAFNVVAGQGKYLRAGDVLQIESEKVRVTIVSTDAITIARGFAGTTNAAHADSTPWAIVGQATVQDAALGASRTTTKSSLYNYTQIYEDSVQITSTQTAIKKWVEQADMPQQLARAMKVCWKVWNRSLIRGQKVATTASVGGAMDGILARITTNAYAKGGSAYLTEAYILQAMQDSWTVGGHIDTILCNAFQKRQMNSFLDSMRMTDLQRTQAGVLVDSYTSDFGTAQIVLDRDIPTDTVLLVEKSRLGFGPLTDHAMKAAPVNTGTLSYDATQIFGQYTSEVRNENAHAKITGLATS
jgi:hypothetical protein